MEHKRVDYNTIATQKNLEGRLTALENEIKSAGYVCLTDAITNYSFGGQIMLERLMRDDKDLAPTGDNRKWKLFVMRDEWGNVPKPGDKVVREILRPFKDRAGRKLRSTAMNDMRRRGTFNRDLVIRREFTVDDKGCIECTYDDAAWFLQEHGVHFEDTGAAICGRREIAGGQCRAPDGNMRTVWYWRYWEAPPWVYDKLPSLNQKKSAPRGRPKKEADTAE